MTYFTRPSIRSRRIPSDLIGRSLSKDFCVRAPFRTAAIGTVAVHSRPVSRVADKRKERCRTHSSVFFRIVFRTPSGVFRVVFRIVSILLIVQVEVRKPAPPSVGNGCRTKNLERVKTTFLDFDLVRSHRNFTHSRLIGSPDTILEFYRSLSRPVHSLNVPS